MQTITITAMLSIPIRRGEHSHEFQMTPFLDMALTTVLSLNNQVKLNHAQRRKNSSPKHTHTHTHVRLMET